MERLSINLEGSYINTTTTRIVSPILLEVTVYPQVSTFLYKDEITGEVVRQFIYNKRIECYFSEVHRALDAIERNKDFIQSYRISCNDLVVGGNFHITNNGER